MRRLVDWPWILQPRTTPTRQVLDGSFAEVGIAMPSSVAESVSIFAILHLVQVSDAVAVLPASVAQAHLSAGLLIHLAMRIEVSVGGFGLVTRKNEAPQEIAHRFIDLLRDHAKRAG